MATPQSMRGYRPGCCVPQTPDPEVADEARRARELSIQLYADLVARGRLLFEDEPAAVEAIQEHEPVGV